MKIFSFLGTLILFIGIQFHSEARPKKWDPSRYAKVAVLQYNPAENAPLNTTREVVDAYKQKILNDFDRYIEEAAKNGAKLIVTPEFGTVGYPDIPELPSNEDDFRNRDDIAPYVESADGKTVTHFSELAKKLQIFIVFGFVEVDTNNRYFNSAVAVDPKGNVVAKYHKINLYGLETSYLSRGETRSSFETDFGRIGLIICYDLKFQEPAINLVESDKVDAIAFPTSWVWDDAASYFEGFSKKNKTYLLAANNTYFPDSGIFLPKGGHQGFIHKGKGLVYGYLPYKK